MTKLSTLFDILFLHLFSLTPKINLVGEYIETQLNMRHSELVKWFKVVELPRIAGFFIPLLNKWSMEYAGRFVNIVSTFSMICNAFLDYYSP